MDYGLNSCLSSKMNQLTGWIITKLRSRKASSIVVILLHEQQMIYLSNIPWKILDIIVSLWSLNGMLFMYPKEDYIKFSRRHSRNSEASHYLPTSNKPYATFLISIIELSGYTNFVPLSFSAANSLMCASKIHIAQNLSLLIACWTVADLKNI